MLIDQFFLWYDPLKILELHTAKTAINVRDIYHGYLYFKPL
jgi:hypothetical protein